MVLQLDPIALWNCPAPKRHKPERGDRASAFLYESLAEESGGNAPPSFPDIILS